MTRKRVMNGIDVLLCQQTSPLEGKRLGLITNHTGVTRDLRGTAPAMLDAGYDLRALFGPEHGLSGAVADGVSVGDEVDPATGLPVYSLYGDTLEPTEEMLEGLDALVFDMQDVGVRFYTYLYALAYSLKSAARQGLAFYVLDRPNPIRGDVVAGRPVDERFKTYVGDYGLPFRIGMTPGEFARYVNELNGWGADLEVVKLEGWDRSLWFDQTDLPWVLPSPNLPTLESAVVYPGTVLFEGTNCSEGRGTGRPFETIGAPWMRAAETCDALRTAFLDADIEGVKVREAVFVPTTSKHEGEACRGFQLHVSDRDTYEPVSAAVVCLKVIHDLHTDEFEWRAYRNMELAVDRLSGSDYLRTSIDAGVPMDELLEVMRGGLEPFLEERTKHLLYQ